MGVLVDVYYNLGYHRSRSMVDSQDSMAVFKELFNDPTPVFIASLVPELFTH